MSDTNDTNPFEGLDSFAIGNPERWKVWVESNTDPYGRGVITYAARWANLIETEIARRELIPAGQPSEWTEDEVAAYATGVRKVVHEIAEATSHQADTEGITGFMYGAAVQSLAESWVHGDALRRWHNKEYGREDANETEGAVVNPAVLAIGGEK